MVRLWLTALASIHHPHLTTSWRRLESRPGINNAGQLTRLSIDPTFRVLSAVLWQDGEARQSLVPGLFGAVGQLFSLTVVPQAGPTTRGLESGCKG